MPEKFAEEGTAATKISMQDCLISRSCAQHGRVPRDGTHSVGVAMHNSNSFHFIDIPDLYLSGVSAQRKVGALQTPGY